MNHIPDFDDLIFEKRNKKYGAYRLRKTYGRTMMISILLGTLFVFIAFFIPFLQQKKNLIKVSQSSQRAIQVMMEEFVPPVEKPLLPPPSAPPAGQAKAIRYLPPVIVDTVIPMANTIASAEEAVEFAGDTTILEEISGFGDLISEGDMTADNDEPFLIVEEMPTFMGGDLNYFRQWVQSRTKYPQEALENEISGKVILTFVIEKNGSVSQVKVVKGVHPILDDEAIRVVSSSPRWKPGLQRGHNVRVRYTMPLIFKLGE
ncbi:energy transducer TonB [bacterium]|nr:energy transducer TonB [bacterium]